MVKAAITNNQSNNDNTQPGKLYKFIKFRVLGPLFVKLLTLWQMLLLSSKHFTFTVKSSQNNIIRIKVLIIRNLYILLITASIREIILKQACSEVARRDSVCQCYVTNMTIICKIIHQKINKEPSCH